MRGLADNPTGPAGPSDLLEAAAGRLAEAVSILDAVDRSELLSVLPKGADAAARHQCAVSLLAVLRRELQTLACELQSASQVQTLMGRLSRSGQAD
ncbi:MAG TPA: hypothetical protein VN694_04760 [Caulobacteraceae bacterium]|nr:hypothetical protein [Caulobacteraceae bacterium]